MTNTDFAAAQTFVSLVAVDDLVITELVPVSDPETGVWCPACALPSAMRVTLAEVISSTLVVTRWIIGTFCYDCHSGYASPV